MEGFDTQWSCWLECSKHIGFSVKGDFESCCAPIRHNVLPKIIPDDLPLIKADIGNHRQLLIPAGKFTMGGDQIFFPTDGEGPSREVFVSDFFIDEIAVTNKSFSEFIDATNFKTEAEILGWSYVFDGFLNEQNSIQKLVGQNNLVPWWQAIAGAYWKNPIGDGTIPANFMELPTVHVSWHDADAYSKWRGFTLPTEAQWEKASRGGLEKMKYPWGNDLLPNNVFMTNIWQGDFPALNTEEDGYFGLAPSKSFTPNGFGLFNTVGNVWEWTSDFWSARWHKKAASETRNDPAGPTKSAGNRVLKGGSFLCHDSYCNRYRNSARTYNSPSSSTSHIGFRCVSSG